MKKKLLSIIMLVALLLMGCNNNTDINNTEATEELSSAADEPVVVEPDNYSLESFDIDWNTWGIEVTDSVKNKDGKEQHIEIKFPTGCDTQDKANGIVSYVDDKIVIYDAYIYSEDEFGSSVDVEGDTINNVITSYFTQTLDIIYDINNKYEIQSLIVSEQKQIKINEYDTCKSTGVITGKLEDKDFEWEYVAFATALKSNGAYVYTYVIDTSEDNKLRETIKEDAIKMILTLKELEWKEVYEN